MKKVYFVLACLSAFIAVNAQVPNYPIGVAAATNANGKIDSANLHCSIQGVVYGVNTRPYGLQFTVNDHTGGVIVYSGSKTYGYTVHEGDSVFVSGKITQFKGAIEISTLDTVYKIGDATIQDPKVVTSLNRSLENSLVRVNGLHFTGTWTPSGRAFSVAASDGTNTFTVRVDSMTTAYTMTPPTGNFDLIALVSLYTSDTTNLNQGWELHPRYASDFIFTTAINEVSPSVTGNLYPNPSNGNFIIDLNGQTATVVNVYDLSGKLVHSAEVNASHAEVNAGSLANGKYFIEAKTSAGFFKSQLTIQK
jgi:hypothetical protein